jgi:hypothetical protein
MVSRSRVLAPGLLALVFASHARAQEPPPQGYPPPPAAPQPYPPSQQPPQPGYPQPLQPLPPPQQAPQPPPPQGYPQQPPPQGYPQQPAPQGYPPQPAPPQAYPPQAYPPQSYPPQQLPPPGYQQPPPGYQQPPPGYQVPPPGAFPPPPSQPLAPPVPNGKRDDGEMLFLYMTSAMWGIGTGIWVDWGSGVNDPGIAFIAPLLFGAAAPIGLFLWDNYDNLDKGVPSSIGLGLSLGAVEGIAIAGTQWQNTCNGNCGTWSDATKAALTWGISTAGGVGGYFFGEYLKPDPRALTFIASGAGWGAISGLLLGAGAESSQWVNGTTTTSNSISPADSFGDGAAVGGLIGYNAGIVATGALSLLGYVPSWRTQQAMWLGYLVGTAGASIVYLFYIGQPDVHHGMIANSLGGLAGVGVAGALTANMKDTAKAWVPPFQIGLAPTPYGGAALAAFGTW